MQTTNLWNSARVGPLKAESGSSTCWANCEQSQRENVPANAAATNWRKRMNARTKTLFHFTKSLDILLRILEEGFWPHYSLEDISWLNGPVPRLAWPIVSFCDIPISRLHEHTNFYGNYGIGLCRERWRATGLNPLLYVSSDSIVKESLRELLLEVEKIEICVQRPTRWLCLPIASP